MTRADPPRTEAKVEAEASFNNFLLFFGLFTVEFFKNDIFDRNEAFDKFLEWLTMITGTLEQLNMVAIVRI